MWMECDFCQSPVSVERFVYSLIKTLINMVQCDFSLPTFACTVHYVQDRINVHAASFVPVTKLTSFVTSCKYRFI